MKKTFRFTLVEVLGVIVLISIVAGLGFAGYSYAMNSAKESSTSSLIKRLEAGLDTIRVKHGYYPVSTGPGKESPIKVEIDSNNIFESIDFGGTEISKTKNPELFKTFIKIVEPDFIVKHTTRIGSSTVLTDAWGGVIRYCSPGVINASKYDLIAPGADGLYGKNKKANTNGLSFEDYRDSDDITNFAL